MSWLFGLNKNPTGIPDAIQVPVSGGEGGGDEGPGPVSSGSDGYRSEAYSFDSTALERAAKAAKVSGVGYIRSNPDDRINKNRRTKFL